MTQIETWYASQIGKELSEFDDYDNYIVTVLQEFDKEICEKKCKETARNVRHKAIEVMNEESLPYRNGEKTSVGDFAEALERKIMNIQFKDVKPE